MRMRERDSRCTVLLTPHAEPAVDRVGKSAGRNERNVDFFLRRLMVKRISQSPLVYEKQTTTPAVCRSKTNFKNFGQNSSKEPSASKSTKTRTSELII